MLFQITWYKQFRNRIYAIQSSVDYTCISMKTYKINQPPETWFCRKKIVYLWKKIFKWILISITRQCYTQFNIARDSIRLVFLVFGKRLAIFRRIRDVTVNRRFWYECVRVCWTLIYTQLVLIFYHNSIAFVAHNTIGCGSRANKLYV